MLEAIREHHTLKKRENVVQSAEFPIEVFSKAINQLSPSSCGVVNEIISQICLQILTTHHF